MANPILFPITYKCNLKCTFCKVKGSEPMINKCLDLIKKETTEWVYIIGPYNSAENILISDADINSQGYLVVAETSLQKSGRIVIIDNFGNSVFNFGEDLFGMVNDVNVKENNLMVVST